MERYTAVPMHGGEREHYAVRVGGIGGRIVGRELRLNQYRADLLREYLAQAFEDGRNDALEGGE